MTTIIGALPDNLTNGTTADASQVMANFNTIVSDVNTNAVAVGANSSITSLSGLTTPLTVAQGGTGQSTLAAFLGSIYPVGALYLETTGTNPATTFGFGTWAAYAAGQAIIGVGSFTDGDGNSETITGGQQIGEYQHTLVTSEIPSHTHTATSTSTVTDPGHFHATPTRLQAGIGSPFNQASLHETSNFTDNGGNINQASSTDTRTTGITISTSTSISNTGGGGGHNNIQPSIGVYIWKRTA